MATDASTPLAPSSEPGFRRYLTGQGLPWEVLPDWSPEALQQRLQRELESARQLFKGGEQPIAHIAQSPFAVPPATLSFKDMSFSVRLPTGEERVILEPTSGCYEAGELVAIMGPSGSGKSTLLDMLANKKTAEYQGTVLVNGHPRDALFRRIAAYVGQEDVMPEHWRVREAVSFNMALKNVRARKVPEEVSSGILQLILESFGLWEVRDSFIGGPSLRGISGGQRRRVTLARGIAAGASLLFCDEPTSGLSATDAELCVRSLRVLAKRFGVLVLVVIHQPRIEVAKLFDQILILTSNPGRTVFNGRMEDAMAHWEAMGFPVPKHANPTDYFLDLATPGAPSDQVAALVRAWESRQQAVEDHVAGIMAIKGDCARAMLEAAFEKEKAALTDPERRLSLHAAPFARQLWLLLQRKVRLTQRSPAALLPLAMPVMMGLVIGSMFKDIAAQPLQQQLPFIFLQLTNLSLTGMQLLPALVQERVYMKFDTLEALYDELAFLLAAVLVDVPLCLLGAVLNVIVMYSFSGLSWDYFGTLLPWAVLLFFVFDSLFGFIAAAARDGRMAQVLALPFQIVFMMFSGFMVTKASAPSYLRWVFDISPNGYAMQAIVMRMVPDFGQEGAKVAEEYGFEAGQDAQGVCVMLSLIVVLRLAQVCAMKFRNNIQK